MRIILYSFFVVQTKHCHQVTSDPQPIPTFDLPLTSHTGNVSLTSTSNSDLDKPKSVPSDHFSVTSNPDLSAPYMSVLSDPDTPYAKP